MYTHNNNKFLYATVSYKVRNKKLDFTEYLNRYINHKNKILISWLSPTSHLLKDCSFSSYLYLITLVIISQSYQHFAIARLLNEDK